MHSGFHAFFELFDLRMSFSREFSCVF